MCQCAQWKFEWNVNVKLPQWINIGSWFWLMNIRMGYTHSQSHTLTHTIFHSMTSNWTSNWNTHSNIHIAVSVYVLRTIRLPLTLTIVSICAACGIRMVNKLISGYSPIGPFLHPINFAHHENTLQIKLYIKNARAHI